MRRFCLWIMFVCIGILPLSAHQTGLSYLLVTQVGEGVVAVTYRKPIEDLQAAPIAINFPAGCRKTESEPVSIENGFATERYRLHCDRSAMTGARIWIEGLVSSDKGVLFRYTRGAYVQKGLLRATYPFVEIEKESSWYSVLIEYLQLGFSHIMSGFDHLLFVLALLFLATSLRELLVAVTSFTLAHSVTLALGIFGVLNVPVPFVESMIALSIVVLYREVRLSVRQKKGRLPLVVFFFGLLHGLGFASALNGIGLPREEIPSALFAFNIGIESGQILFIVVAMVVLKSLYRMFHDEKRIKNGIATLAGSVATFWLIERVSSF